MEFASAPEAPGRKQVGAGNVASQSAIVQQPGAQQDSMPDGEMSIDGEQESI